MQNDVHIKVERVWNLEILELLPEGGMCPKVNALTSGNSLQQNPAKLLTKDAVDYEVDWAEKERKYNPDQSDCSLAPVDSD